MTQSHFRTQKIAMLARQPLEYRGIVPLIPMAPQFLCLNNLDGPVNFLRTLRLPNPITRWHLVLGRSHKLRRNQLRHATASAAALLHIKIASN
jgi:hypothetical protein